MHKSRTFPEVIRSVWPRKMGTGERCARKPARTVRGRGGQKSVGNGNSLAAYSTLRITPLSPTLGE
jgi:hypothetical protein